MISVLPRSRWLAGSLALAGSALSGCGAPPSAARPASVVEIEPKLDSRSRLRLARLGNELAVGDAAERVSEIFPLARGAYSFSDAPAMLGEGFEAKGWETSTEGFGAILSAGKVALAMRQFPGVDRTRADDLQAALVRANGDLRPEIISGRNVEFRFWVAGEATLMFLRTAVKADQFDVTEALGDTRLMNALGMSPTKARAMVAELNSAKPIPPPPLPGSPR